MHMRSKTKALVRRAVWVVGMLVLTTAGFAYAAPASSLDKPSSLGEPSSLDEQRVDLRIIGGSEVSRGKYPFMATLQFNSQHLCGGSLYRSDVVITAAHCVVAIDDDSAALFSVTVGKTLLSDQVGAQRRGISKVAVSAARGSDLALIFLDRPVRGVVPVSLPTLGSDALYRPGQLATVLGWGNTDAELPFFPNRLREVDVPILAPEECALSYPSNDLSTYFCAGVQGKDSCQGDSGGPIVRSIGGGRVYQIGVVSFGDGCAERGAPGVYADLSSGDLWNSLRFVWERSSKGKRVQTSGSGIR